jgi:hypothetical protein
MTEVAIKRPFEGSEMSERAPKPIGGQDRDLMMVELDFVLRVLRIFDGDPGPDGAELFWRTDAPEFAPVTFFARCDDFFMWGGSDGEPITPDNIGDLEQAVADMRALGLPDWDKAHLLWIARKRGMRPQGAYYTYIEKEYWPLFDACGPERETGFGNPYKPGEHWGGATRQR